MAANKKAGALAGATEATTPNHATAAGSSNLPDNRAQRQHHETAEDGAGDARLRNTRADMGGGHMTDARYLTLKLGGRWYGGYGSAPCPVCQPDGRKGQNALTLHDGRIRLLLHCKKAHCNFTDVLVAAGVAPGMHASPNPAEIAHRDAQVRAESAKRTRQAERLWREAQPIAGTIAERYLSGRGIICALPPTLRFHPEAWHGPSAKKAPAIVALVEGGKGFSVHRTYLRADGSGKAALDPDKMMLGAVAGGAVRLSDAPFGLVVTEGIETALSLACGLLRAPATILAALSTSGLRRLRLPLDAGRLTIAQDGDKAGRAAARELAERAHAAGWRVSLLDPGDGLDFNDVLRWKKTT